MKLNIELTIDDKNFDSERLKNDLEVMRQTLGMMSCVKGVDEWQLGVKVKEYVVHYNERFAKVVKAESPEEASERVEKGEGDTLFYEREEISVEEYP